MRIRPVTKKEYDGAIIQMIEELKKSLPVAGVQRKKDWIKGLSYNEKYPRYFGKHKVNRLNGKLVYALDKNYERKKLYSILTSLFHKYLPYSYLTHEFGCGTGHIIDCFGQFGQGYDWANPKYKYFDFFKPYLIDLKNDAVYTVAALEQVGTNYKKFVSMLLKGKPNVVIHVEPIEELLDPTNLLDYLSLEYMRKRKYLSGYLTYLRKLEKQGKLTIIEARRSGVGSLFIDGYSVIVWKPN